MKVLEKLLALVNLIGQRKRNVMNNNELGMSEFLGEPSQSNELELYIGEKEQSVCEVITSFTVSLLENDNGKREETKRKGKRQTKEADERTTEPARQNSAESQCTTRGRSCSSFGAGTMPHAQQSPNH
ncbi:hypothetical protein niasHT_039491 [Heterodera trifolii]|uniref:Uncharacterized protein n=1 Tax=Heterodera trifolii TaxID=157864 RepID=A0ABD2HV13_9BILA